MIQKNKKFAEVGETSNMSSVPLWVLTDAVATTYDSTISADTEIELDADTAMVSITVLEAPVFLKAKTATAGTAVSSSNFSRLLSIGQHDFFLQEDITHLSFIEESAGAKIAVSEFKY